MFDNRVNISKQTLLLKPEKTEILIILHALILTKLKINYHFCVFNNQVTDSLKYFIMSSTCHKLKNSLQKASIFKCYIDIGNIYKNVKIRDQWQLFIKGKHCNFS